VRKTSVENGNTPDSGCTGRGESEGGVRAKVEAEAVHGAQEWKIHHGIQPWAPCVRLLVYFPFPVKLVHTHVVLITEEAH